MFRNIQLVTLGIILALGTAAAYHSHEIRARLDATDTQYCTMVKLGKETRSNLGWPDFRRTYNTLCK